MSDGQTSDFGPSGEQAAPDYDLRLYISGSSPRSLRAIDVVRRMCERMVPGRYRLSVIDVYDNPTLARADQIVAVPTLVRTAPVPKRLLVGDMSDQERLAAGFR